MLGPLGRMLRAVSVSIGGAGRRIRPLAAVAKPEVTPELASLAAAGRLRAVVERTFTLSEAREALAHIDGGRTVGKVVVDVGPPRGPGPNRSQIDS
jgi:NADPH:quinone reductase-like Zn-dependent oxidoreductase